MNYIEQGIPIVFLGLLLLIIGALVATLGWKFIIVILGVGAVFVTFVALSWVAGFIKEKLTNEDV